MRFAEFFDTIPVQVISVILVVLFLGISTIQLGMRVAGGIRAAQWASLLNVVSQPLFLIVVVMLAIRLAILLIANAPADP